MTTTTEPAEKVGIALSKEKTQELFEAKFGKDSESRTRKQWKALVNQYGYPTVMEKERMTKAQVKSKCKN